MYETSVNYYYSVIGNIYNLLRTSSLSTGAARPPVPHPSLTAILSGSIMNSSFSLLSTYLNKNFNNDKLVLAPKMWFGVNGPKFNIQDIYEDAIFI